MTALRRRGARWVLFCLVLVSWPLRSVGRGNRRRNWLTRSAPSLGGGRLGGGRLCSDSCAHGKNGICEDGGALLSDGERAKAREDPKRSTIETIRCDLGTDCSDCGVRFPPAPAATFEQIVSPAVGPAAAASAAAAIGRASSLAPRPSAPIEVIEARGATIRAAWTATQPSFIMPFTSSEAGSSIFLFSHPFFPICHTPILPIYHRIFSERQCSPTPHSSHTSHPILPIYHQHDVLTSFFSLSLSHPILPHTSPTRILPMYHRDVLCLCRL